MNNKRKRKKKKEKRKWAWLWPIIPTLEGLREEDIKFKVSLDYIASEIS
jgi:hypothetical protein